MKLHQLTALVKVTDLGSVRSAARALGLSQPGLSRAIRELEADLGVRLLDRTSKGVVMTPAGVVFLKRARVVLNEITCAREEMRQSSAAGELESTGSIRAPAESASPGETGASPSPATPQCDAGAILLS